MRAFPSASALAPEDLNALIKAGTAIRALDDSVLFDAGDSPSAVLLVVEGRVRVERMLDNGQRLPLGLLSRGHIVGDMGLLSGEPRSAAAVVDKELLALRLDVSTYATMRQEGHPAVQWLLGEINARMAERVADMYRRIARGRDNPELIEQLPSVEPAPARWFERPLRWLKERLWS